jgi:hypothetical protein
MILKSDVPFDSTLRQFRVLFGIGVDHELSVMPDAVSLILGIDF